MNDAKYIGMDVHKETTSMAVMDGSSKSVMDTILETKALTILQLVQGLHGRFGPTSHFPRIQLRIEAANRTTKNTCSPAL